MLGVTVICIALAGALFGAYLAGIETDEHEITAYEYLADMSGEFEFDQSPQYIDFDPNTNYIGYYSTDTGNMFPLEKVDFVEYQGGANNYAIKLPSELISEGTDVELNVFEAKYGVDMKTTRSYSLMDEKYDRVIRPAVQPLSEFINANIPNITQKHVIHLKSPGEIYDPGEEIKYYQTNWIFITRDADWNDWAAPSYFCCTPEYKSANPSTTLNVPCLSCKIDIATNTVERYYDSNCEQYCDTIDMDMCKIVYGGVTTKPGMYYIAQFMLSSTFDYEIYDVSKYVYMDPTKGVELKEATA